MSVVICVSLGRHWENSSALRVDQDLFHQPSNGTVSSSPQSLLSSRDVWVMIYGSFEETSTPADRGHEWYKPIVLPSAKEVSGYLTTMGDSVNSS